MSVSFTQEPAHERVLILERDFDAPRAIVWRSWTAPRLLVRWWPPPGFTLPVCEQDFHVGGFYRFGMSASDGSNHWVWGAYHDIVEPERIVFTWEREDEEGLRKSLNNLVTITLKARGRKTALELHHSVFQTIADRDYHHGRWTERLDRLAVCLEPPV